MSDQSDDKAKSSEKEGESTAHSAEEKPSWNPADEPPRNPAAESPPKAAAQKGSSKLAWLALLLIIALGAGAAWLLQEAQRREAVFENRLAGLENVESGQEAALQTMDQQLQSQLRTGLSKLESAIGGQATQLKQIEASLEIQRDDIAHFGATDRNDWLLAEAEYLLRLANQRLIMAGDVSAAAGLLASADNILRELEDSNFHGARAAVAADLAALRAVPKIDVEGLYLRLSALIEQVTQLVIFELPDGETSVQAAPAEDWQGRLKQGYEQALQKFFELIVVRPRTGSYESLMDPQLEDLVRQNMRMLLEQAQIALLSGNQLLFRESLQRAGHWVEQFFEVDEAGSRAIARDIMELTDQTIAADVPDVSRSLRELDEAVERRLLLEDGR